MRIKTDYRNLYFLKNSIRVVFLIIGFYFNGSSQTTQTYQTAGSYTWVCPANVLQIRVQCWGGGKGGSQSSYGGSGGAGGAYSSGILNVIPGNTYYINCAFGGYGNGGDTWFSNFNGAPSIIQEGFLAKGGSGFDNGSLSIGDTVFSGGLTGGFAWSGQLGCGGGGGSSAGPLGQGNNGVNTSGGVAGQGGGNGGNGTCFTYQSANSGLSPGGGGGGSVGGLPGAGAPGKIIITEIPSCMGTPNTGFISTTPSSGCGATSLIATGLSTSPGVNYQWQSSTNDISWTDISGATSSIYTAHTNTTTYYRLRSTCVFGWSSYSNRVIYTFTGNAAQPAPSVNPITIDCGQTGIVTATGGGTQDYIWFSDAQALNQLGTGASYTTPILSNSANYYVASSVNPQYTQTYYIEIADLINLNQYCGNGSIYGSGVVGFNWNDLLPAEANVVSVSADLSIGSECSAGLKNVTFNGASQTGFTTASNCGCSGYAYQIVPLSPTNYIKGGTNQFRVTNASSFGFNLDYPDFLTYLARINVTYTISTPCYSDLTVAQVIVLPPPPIIASSDQTICSGTSPSDITLSGNFGTVQWQVSSDNSNWSNISGATSATLSSSQMVTLTATRYYRAVVTSGACGGQLSSTVSVTVNSISSGTAASTQTFCFTGDPTALTFSVPASGAGTLSYQWQSSSDNSVWSNISGESNANYDPSVLSSTMYYRVIVSSTLNSVVCNSSTNVVAAYINNPGGGVVGSDQTICSGGSPAAFTVSTPASGLGTLSYQWELSLDNLSWAPIGGATAATYASGALTQTTYFRRMVTSTYNSIGCTAYSNTVTVYVNQVSAGLVGSNQTICSGGDPDAFVPIIAATGAGVLTYQWQSSTNGFSSWWTNITGATSAEYDPPSGQTTSMYYQVIVTSLLNGNSCSTPSNTVLVTVNSVTGGSISGNQTICSGGNPTAFTSTGSGLASGTLSYQWQYSTDNLNWANVPSSPVGTNASYNADTIWVTTYYRRLTLSYLNGTSCPEPSNTITVSINQINSVLIGSDQTLCTGEIPNTLSFVSMPSGSGNLTYQWQHSTNGTTWTNIIGGTGASLTSAQMGSLNATRFYQVIVTSWFNGGVCTSTSNIVTIRINTISSGVIGSNQTVCVYNDLSILTFTTLPSATGNLTYQWQYSNDNTNWSDLANDTLSTYDPGSLSNTTYYHVIVTSILNGVGCTETTSSVAITVNAFNPGTIGTDQMICPGGIPATFTSVSSPSGTGTFSYQWEKSTDIINWIPITGATASTYSVTSSITVTTYYRRITKHTANGITCSLPTNIVMVSVYAAGTISSSQNICSGSLPLSLTVTGAVGTPLWQKSTNGSTWTSTGITGSTLSSSQIGVLTSSRYYRIIITGVTCTQNLVSNSVLITLLNPPTISAGTDQTICSGNSVTLSASGGTSYSWNNGVTNNTPFVPVSTQNYMVTGTASNGCTNTDQVLVTVNTTPSISIIDNNPAIICQGQTFILSSSISSGVSYQWLRNGNPISGATNSIYNGTLSGSYTLSVTSTQGCSSTAAPVSITITPLPTVSAGVDQEICEGSLVTLTGSGASNYSWNNGVNDGVAFFPSSTAIYTVSTTANTGCIGTDQVVVTVRYPSSSVTNTTSMGDYYLNGTVYSQSGTYTQNTLNQYGCDSIITLNLMIVYAGVNSLETLNGIKLFPNPSLSGIYFLSYPDQFSCEHISIMAANGKLIKEYFDNPYSLDMIEVEAGNYFVEFICGEERFIIQIQKM